MKGQIESKIKSYTELYNSVYEERIIGENIFTSSDMEYLDTIEMMIEDLKEILDSI